jgi:hypothetical protein
MTVGYKNSITPLTWDFSRTSFSGELGLAIGSDLSRPGRLVWVNLFDSDPDLRFRLSELCAEAP